MVKQLIGSKEVAEILGISEDIAQNIISSLNSELRNDGRMVIEDRCSLRYLAERFYIQIGEDGQQTPVPFSTADYRDSVYRKAYDYLIRFVHEHQDQFVVQPIADNQSNPRAVIGEIDAEIDAVFIIKSAFDEIMTAGGYRPGSFLSWAKREGLLAHKLNRHTVMKRIKNAQYNCVCIHFQDSVFEPSCLPISRYLSEK